MPFLISPSILKQQAKALQKNWPFPDVKISHVREVLCQLYGFRNHHDYQKQLLNKSAVLIALDKQSVGVHYISWIKKLARGNPSAIWDLSKRLSVLRMVNRTMAFGRSELENAQETECFHALDCAIFRDSIR